MKIAIIGAGASGLFAGGVLSEKHEVTIFDKNEKCGKKLYITGKGRCNLTNNCSQEQFLASTVNGSKFMFSSIHQLSPQDIIDFFEKHGLKTKTERGGRVFPASDKSSDVIKTLKKFCSNCQIKLKEEVLDICFVASENLFKILTEEAVYYFDRVIVATGGQTYSSTGSSGDGYKFAKAFGHKIMPIQPGLVPIELGDKFIKQIQGVTLKNVSLNAVADGKKFSFFGEMLFTDRGISGPIALTMSSFINRAKAIELAIDFKPALTKEMLEKRVLKDVQNNLNKTMGNFVNLFLPRSVGEVLLQRLKIDSHQKVNEFTAAERKDFIALIKNFTLKFKSLYPLDSGIITSGGVVLDQINPKTMESKLQKGLYFIGEVLAVDCLTGGYNLTSAFATAYSCAVNLK